MCLTSSNNLVTNTVNPLDACTTHTVQQSESDSYFTENGMHNNQVLNEQTFIGKNEDFKSFLIILPLAPIDFNARSNIYICLQTK